MIIVSACLAGFKCNYKGKCKSCPEVEELVRSGKAIPVCPEQLGGMSTPREAAEQRDGGFFTKNGKDVTFEFEKGAQEVVRLAKVVGCSRAILKARSPSCGSLKVYDGTFSGRLVDGDGVLSHALKKIGVEVMGEEDFK